MYYVDGAGKRHAFPNEKIFFTWYENFDDVMRITDQALAQLPLASNVTYKPGAWMIKIQTDPKVYAVARGGQLRWIKDEATATALYGANWANAVQDLSDAFFSNYLVGDPIFSANDFQPYTEFQASPDIGDDLDHRIALLPTNGIISNAPPTVNPLVTIRITTEPIRGLIYLNGQLKGQPNTVGSSISVEIDPRSANTISFGMADAYFSEGPPPIVIPANSLGAGAVASFTGTYALTPKKINLFPDTGWIQVEVNPAKNNIILGVQQKLDASSMPINTVFYSEDYGQTWTKSGAAYKVSIDRINPQIVYGVSGSGLVESTDWGKTFKSVQTTLGGNPYSNGFYNVFSDRFISQKIYLAGNGWGLYVSTDGGKTLKFLSFDESISVPESLKKTNLSRKIWSIDQDPKNQNVLYTSSEDGAHMNYQQSPSGGFLSPHADDYYVVRTVDGGLTWQAISSGLSWHSLVIHATVDPATGQTVWLCGQEGGGLYRLNTATSQWEKILDLATQVDDILDFGGKARLLSNSYSLYETLDGGKTWNEFLKDASSRYTWLSAANNGDLYIADSNNGIVKIPNRLK